MAQQASVSRERMPDHLLFADWWEGYTRLYPPDPAWGPPAYWQRIRRRAQKRLKAALEGVDETANRIAPGQVAWPPRRSATHRP